MIIASSGNVPISVPSGGIYEIFDKDDQSRGEYVFENFNINRPTQRTDRPNGHNAAVDEWVLRGGQVTATATIQVATSSTEFPQVGDYVEDDFEGGYHDENGDLTLGDERFVVESVSQPFNMGDYWKVNVNLVRAIIPA